MKYLHGLLTKYALLLVAIFTVLAVLLHMRSIEWPCLNSDEASFAYNAYSILKTGRDEYGILLPTRFLAFGENKLPVTIYTMVPFIGIFGLNEIAARLPFILLGAAMPFLFFGLVRKLSGNTVIAVIAAYLAAISPWIQIMSRHIHENVIMLALVIAMLWYLIQLTNKVTIKALSMLAVLTGIALFTYHIGKVIAVFVIAWIAFHLFATKQSFQIKRSAVILLAIPVILFGITELMNPSTRIANLLFMSNQGFTLRIEELRNEHDNRLIHNKVTHAATILSQQYLSYFSPEFLVRRGDNNARFGFEGISPITPIEYVFVFIGVFYVFHRKEKYRMLMLSLFLTAPLTASLSWQEYSLTRSFLMIIPIIYFSATGIYYLSHAWSKRVWQWITAGGILVMISFFSFLSWDYYFNHYPLQKEAISAWQCGYKDVGTFLNDNAQDFDRIYFTKKLGQPYIFTLFYMEYPPAEYHKEAKLSELDEYGFGQVEGYSIFDFNFEQPDPNESELFIGYPEEFPSNTDMDRVTKVTQEGYDIFWIYEGRRNK